MKTPWQLLLLLVLCGFTFFGHLEQFAPDLMEARNFITAREMLQEGHWLAPTMNLEPRLEKPPLPTWITAVTAQLGGGLDDPLTMRFPGALMGTLMVFFFYGFSREASKEKYLPLLGGAILATSLLVVQLARTNSWDIHAHAFMIGGIWLLWRGWKRGGWLNFVLSGVLVGLAVLSKGPVPLYVPFLPFVVAFGFGKNSYLKKYWKETLMALVLGLIIGFGWNAYIYLELPEEMAHVVNKETGSWGARHVRPFYFYLHFPLYIGIWAVFMVAAFFYKYAAPRIGTFGNYRAVLVWILLTIVLLSVVPTKKERYLLPALAPMALMVTFLLHAIIKAYQEGRENKWDRVVLNTFGLIICGAGLAVPFVGNFILDGFNPTPLFVATTVAIGLLGAFGFWALYRKKAKELIVSAILMVAFVASGTTPQLSDLYYQHPNFKGISAIQNNPELKDLPCITTGNDPNMKLVWALGKPLKTVKLEELDLSTDLPAVFIGTPPEEWLNENAEKVKATDYGTFDYFRQDSEYKAIVTRLEHADE